MLHLFTLKTKEVGYQKFHYKMIHFKKMKMKFLSVFIKIPSKSTPFSKKMSCSNASHKPPKSHYIVVFLHHH